LITVDAVEGEDDHHDEVGDEEGDVEGVPAVLAVEGVVGEALPVRPGGEEERERVEVGEQGWDSGGRGGACGDGMILRERVSV
jgi:hypothetical protein